MMEVLMIVSGVMLLVGGYIVSRSSGCSFAKPNGEIGQAPALEVHSDPVWTASPDTPYLTKSAVSPAADEKARNEKMMQQAIELAIADGVLTAHEQGFLQELARKKGLDFNKIIKNIEGRFGDSKP